MGGNGRFPTNSMSFPNEIREARTIIQLMNEHPDIDVWCEEGVVFAVHLGSPAKSVMSKHEDWNELVNKLEKL
jgi:hypothetical protein